MHLKFPQNNIFKTDIENKNQIIKGIMELNEEKLPDLLGKVVNEMRAAANGSFQIVFANLDQQTNSYR